MELNGQDISQHDDNYNRDEVNGYSDQEKAEENLRDLQRGVLQEGDNPSALQSPSHNPFETTLEENE